MKIQSKFVVAAAMVAMCGLPPTVAAEIPPLFQKGREKQKPVGLRQRISEAETATEVEALLREGKEFAMASEKTRRSWTRTAKRRIKQLELN